MKNLLLAHAEAIILLATQQPEKYKEIAYSEAFILPEEAHNLLSKRVNIYDIHLSDNAPIIEINFRFWFHLQEKLEYQGRYHL